MKIVHSKRQVPRPIKLIEGIGNRGNGALIRSTTILWTNDQYFVLLRSTGVYGKPSPVEQLRIYISRPCRSAPLYRPMLILACLTGVTALGFYIPQWLQTPTTYNINQTLFWCAIMLTGVVRINAVDLLYYKRTKYSYCHTNDCYLLITYLFAYLLAYC